MVGQRADATLDPASTLESPAGVSKLPNGGDTAPPLATTFSVTLSWPVVLATAADTRLLPLVMLMALTIAGSSGICGPLAPLLMS